jgi:hypothetical protein
MFSDSIHCLHFLFLPECKFEHFTQFFNGFFKKEVAHLEEHFLSQNNFPLLDCFSDVFVLIIDFPHVPHWVSIYCFDNLSLLLYVVEHLREQNELLHFETSLELLTAGSPQFTHLIKCFFLPLDSCWNCAQHFVVQNVFRLCLMFDNRSPFLLLTVAPQPIHVIGNTSLALNLSKKSLVRCWY